MKRSSSPGRDRDFFIFKQAQAGLGAHPAFSPMSINILFQWKKRPERDIEHSPPPSARGKSERSCISIFPVCHHDMYGTNLLCQQNTGIFVGYLRTAMFLTEFLNKLKMLQHF